MPIFSFNIPHFAVYIWLTKKFITKALAAFILAGVSGPVVADHSVTLEPNGDLRINYPNKFFSIYRLEDKHGKPQFTLQGGTAEEANPGTPLTLMHFPDGTTPKSIQDALYDR